MKVAAPRVPTMLCLAIGGVLLTFSMTRSGTLDGTRIVPSILHEPGVPLPNNHVPHTVLVPPVSLEQLLAQDQFLGQLP